MMIGMLRLYELSPHPSILDGRFGPDTLSFKEIVAVSRGAKETVILSSSMDS